MLDRSFNSTAPKKKPNYKKGAEPVIAQKPKAIPASRLMANSPLNEKRELRTLVDKGSTGIITTAGGRKFTVALPCEHMVNDAGECRWDCDEWRAIHGRAA